MSETTMTAIAIRNGKGDADALHAVEQARPQPGPGQVLIRVHAAGINRPDLLQRGGHYPPPPGAPETLGLEVAGDVVVAAGRWKVGDRVCALLGGGGYAQYAVVDARHVLPVPDGMTLVQAAALPETIFTAYANLFEHGRLAAGEWLLLHGATSGIGVTAIQLAKVAGAHVLATARSAGKAAQARELGADVAIDSTTESFVAAAKAHAGVDVALDMVGASVFADTLEALNPRGRIVYIASQAGATLEVPIPLLMRKQAIITGSTLRPRNADEKARLAAEVERVVWPWIAQGKVRVLIDQCFPLAEAAAAHRYLEQGSHLGKVVLEM
ncbi:MULTISPECIES: NAD(P)H-quinone oxidoreductase [Xanthomonas]|uniref:Quinone oxidoreductase n=1 Tax=Xanthomonas campestris pv. campestris (strain B100) TaxID=509169 RepID=B0RV87_XANCB|nr:NAD(P)H-quinone oxidoreductase [Xanthomonas campestris]MBF9172446.1 NAD(P)H-quinone oxidoreductase [Xanthomonas campestris pv. campestris]MCC3252844.1 NAD(P)H-quinone oxidoreductase [Xanthomonas campestris pv. armoraciae]MCC5042472.1 NAD(P)H-quinone oxidoreductase [Xanthomonas campestris]MCF8840178.1 NAD(P)H-quinone oxidoreductase [Xanthomonas campestris pv. campestris]MDO0840543.1 NAD(P)H-quinone oxidoreductase [Xanthomonas campestris pv. campestris]